MDSSELKDCRILIVDDKPHTVNLLRGILTNLGVTNLTSVPSSEAALRLLRQERFQIVFCDENAKPLNPVAFCIAMRRDPETKDPTLSVVLISSGTRRRQVELLRDAGANEILALPFSIETVKRKLQAVVLAPKPFVAAKTFLGPCRRRDEGDGRFNGQDRRNAIRNAPWSSPASPKPKMQARKALFARVHAAFDVPDTKPVSAA